MNSKKTNRLVAILNIVTIILIAILLFLEESSNIMLTEEGLKSIYNSSITDILVNNLDIIITSLILIVGIFNIICGIQNRKNKKLFFWQIAFGVCMIITAIAFRFEDYEEIIDYAKLVLYGIIPIIFAIKNLILIKNNSRKVIQIISYVIAIIISLLYILGLGTYWTIISIVMQLIYIHCQEKNIEETKARKIVNIILYWILELMLLIAIFVIAIISLCTTKINENKIEEPLNQLYNNIKSMRGAENSKLLIPVKKDNKYGFIDEDEEEKISCQYDRVSFFYEVEIDNSNYYVALAKNNDEFYLISKSNDNAVIEGDLKKYLQGIENNLESMVTNEYDLEGNYTDGYVYYFGIALKEFIGIKKMSYQELENNNENSITLIEEENYDSYKYYYNNGNYSMEIEPIYDDYKYYNVKCKVTITKISGEKEESTVYLPGFNDYEGSLYTFSNGYIEFENEEGTRRGWYDDDGNQVTIPIDFEIIDIKDNKAILQIFNVEDENFGANFIIIDMTGKTLLRSQIVDVYDDKYLIKNSNGKMVFVDSELREISNEYDKIISNREVDMFNGYN